MPDEAEPSGTSAPQFAPAATVTCSWRLTRQRCRVLAAFGAAFVRLTFTSAWFDVLGRRKIPALCVCLTFELRGGRRCGAWPARRMMT
jgi:hypothetical protein